MSDSLQPKLVSRFEANLLRLLRFFLKQMPAEQAGRFLNDRLDQPPCLSAGCVELARDYLSKGCVLYLVRAGGWQRDRFLRNGEPRFGRLWERSPVEKIALSFTPAVLDFLIWVTANRPKEEQPTWTTDPNQLSVGDQLFFFLVYEGLRSDRDLATILRTSEVFASNPLVWLTYPNDFAGETVPPLPSFEKLLSGEGSLLLEALQPVFETQWLEIERTKGQIGDWTKMNQEGIVQLRLVNSFLESAEQTGRTDVVRFLLVVMSRVLATPTLSATFWTGGLQGSGPMRLADRLQTQQNALSLLRQVERLRTWERRARSSGFMDEDYAANKFWLSEWERYDFTTIGERAELVIQQLEPIRIG
jgi:hypothetical protein